MGDFSPQMHFYFDNELGVIKVHEYIDSILLRVGNQICLLIFHIHIQGRTGLRTDTNAKNQVNFAALLRILSESAKNGCEVFKVKIKYTLDS